MEHMKINEKGNQGVWYSSKEFEKSYTYSEGNLGAEWTKDRTIFRVWAPTAEKVSVHFYQKGCDSDKELAARVMECIAMKPYQNGVWVAEKEGDLQGIFYTYVVLTGGEEREACDPYAKAVGVNGERAMVVDLSATNPEGWDRDKSPFQNRNATDAVIYEAHIRDLTVHNDSGIVNKGKFLGLAEEGTINGNGDITGLDYIADLGVTHIHLLPFFDYASVDETQDGQYNWGYDPKNFFALEGSYATDPYRGEVRIREAKKMIAAFHQKGIGVVMDVVFNHVHNAESFCFNRIVPGYFSRIDSDGIYSNGSICGNDTASERSMIREYIVQNVLYWVEEYHIDGFRFDLVGLLDITTINEIVERVHAVRPEVLFYGEGWAMPTNVTKTGIKMATQKNAHLTPDFAYFNDTIRNLLRGRNSDTGEKGYVNGGTGRADGLKSSLMGIPYWASSPEQVVNYASCHDDLTLYDKLQAAEPTADRAALLRSNRLAAGIVFASAGIPFIQAGEELIRRKINADGTLNANSYDAGDGTNAILWDCLQNADCREMRDYYRGLITFRKNHPSLRMKDIMEIRDRYTFYDIQRGEEVILLIDCEGIEGETARQLCIVFNPEQEEKEVSLPEGNWEIHVSDNRAGIVCIGKAAGSVTVPPVSCMFLVK